MKNLILLLVLLSACSEKEPIDQGTPEIPFGHIKISQKNGVTDNRYHFVEIRDKDRNIKDQSLYHYETRINSYDGDVYLPKSSTAISQSSGIFEVVERHEIARSGNSNTETGDWVKEIEMIVYVRANYQTGAFLTGFIDFPQYEETINITPNLVRSFEEYGIIYLAVKGEVKTKNDFPIQLEMVWQKWY